MEAEHMQGQCWLPWAARHSISIPYDTLVAASAGTLAVAAAATQQQANRMRCP